MKLSNFAIVADWRLHIFTAAKKCERSASLNAKVAVYHGEITALEVDAIVNATNSRLLPGGGGKSFYALIRAATLRG